MEAIDLMMQTSKYQKSPRWLTHGIYVPDMDEDLVNTVFHAIAHLKWRNVQLLISEQSQKLQQVSDVSELDNLLRLIQQLKAYEMQLGKDALGIVVAR